jgi:MYXO-CTERM domain-containing protein
VKLPYVLSAALALGLAALLGAPHEARANGRFPATNALVVAPKDPTFLVLRATYGVLISRDAGKNWDWVCEQSLGFSGIEDPPIALTEKPAIVGALFAGLSVSQDRGCSFALKKGSVDGRIVNDVVVAKSRPREVLAIASSYASKTEAGASSYLSTVFASRDEGETWEPSSPSLDPSVLFETIEIAESDPARVYLSGARDGANGPEGVIFVSTSSGASFVEHKIPLVAGERAPFIGAVDPKNADRVYVRTGGGPDLVKSRLLVSDDAGKTFREAWASEGPMTGFAISPDGEKVYAGSAKDGLVVASKTALAFEARSKIQVQCLAVTDDRVLACSNEVSGFVAGSSTDDGKTFTPMLRLAGLRGPLACGSGTSTTDECVKQWPRVRAELGIPTPDAGAPAADASPSASPAPTSSGGCGSCSSVPTSGAGAAFAGLGALVVGYVVRRRRER